MHAAGLQFALIHSPLVGPPCWTPVAAALAERGVEAHVPELQDDDAETPYWQQHAESVARALAARPAGRRLVLAGHSGAGPILPAIAAALARSVAAYIFVDAGLPCDGATRLDLLRSEAPAFAESFTALIEAGGRYPEWSDADLQPLVPHADLRRRLLADLRPRGRAFWEEPIPVFAAWPDAPCAYLQFSPAYARPAAQAEQLGWPLQRLQDSGHFEMLVQPARVADAMLGLLAQIDRRTVR